MTIKDPTATRRQAARATKMQAAGYVKLSPIWLTPAAAEALARLTDDGITRQDAINNLLTKPSP